MMDRPLKTVLMTLAASTMVLAALLFIVGAAVVCLLAASDPAPPPPVANGPLESGVIESVAMQGVDWPEEPEAAQPAQADALADAVESLPAQQ